MAARNFEELKQKGDIIRAIENSSTRQLRELVEIKKILGNKSGFSEPSSTPVKITRRSRDAANDSGYKPNTLGLRLSVNGKAVKSDAKGNLKLNIGSREYQKELPENAIQPRKRVSLNQSEEKTKNDKGNDSDIKTPETRRDSKGRFTSSQSNDEFRAKNERERERKLNIKDQEGFWSKFGDSLKETLEDKNASDSGATEIAGRAAGGVFWSAGKEFYDVAANATKSAYQFSKKFQRDADNDDEIQEVKPKKVTTQPDDLVGSAKQLEEKNTADNIRDEKKARDKNLKENEHQTEILEELLDESKKKEGNDSLLGKLAAMLGGALGLDSIGDIFDRKKNPKNKKPKKVKPKGKLGKFGKVGKALKIGAGVAAVGTGGAYAYDKITNPDKPPAPKATEKEIKAAEKAGQTAERKAALSAVDNATEKAMMASAAKEVGLLAKSIPLLGTVISAVEGVSDREGQERAFGAENIGMQQELSYAGMNILDFGGLTSGAFNLLSDGLEWAGVSSDFTNEYTRLDPAIAAKQLDDFISSVGDMASSAGSAIADVAMDVGSSVAESVSSGWNSMVDFFSGDSESKKAQEENIKKKEDVKPADANKEVIEAINTGTEDTVTAIKDLTKQITIAGGVYGQDGVQVPTGGVAPSPVTENVINSDLNIGGTNSKNRSFRNNNFGNLQYVGQEGAVLEDANSKGEARFAKFATPEEGFRALANQLNLYSEGKSKAAGYKKLNTVEDIINLYAPNNENDTKGYIKNLSASLGVKKNDQLNLNDPDMMVKMMRGIATIEGGNPQVTDDFIKNAIGQRDASGKWRGKFSQESLTAINKKRQEKGLSAITENDQFSNPETVRNYAPKNAQTTQAVKSSEVKEIASIVSSELQKTEGLRKTTEIQPKSPEKTKSEIAQDKNTKKSEELADKPAESDKKGLMEWFNGVTDIAQAFAEEELGKIEGLRDVKESSALMMPDSMKNPISGSTSGREVSAYEYKLEENPAELPAEASSDGYMTDINGTKYKLNDQNNEKSSSFFEDLGNIIVPSLADSVQKNIGSIDTSLFGNEVLSSMGISHEVQGTLSPITNKLYDYSDKAMSDIADYTANGIRSVSPVHESRSKPLSVTDFAGSGMKTEATITKESNDRLIAEMQKMNESMNKLLGITKDNGKVKSSSEVTNTPQPQPKKNDVNIQPTDGALMTFLDR